MSRIPIPATIEAAPASSQPLLQAVKAQLGVAPNLFRLVANSPAALEGYVSMFAALGKGRLPAPTRERIALAVAEINGCDYCLSAHTYLGREVAKLDDARNHRQPQRRVERHPGRCGGALRGQGRRASRPRERRGFPCSQAAGYNDAQIIEIVQHVALNTWTNYVNSVAQTEIDFPSSGPAKSREVVMDRPPLPPYTLEAATRKVRMAEDAWNSRDPERVALAYTTDSRWRNRAEFLQGRDDIKAFLKRKWQRELDYRLIKELWTRRKSVSACGLPTSGMTMSSNGSAVTATRCGNSMHTV